MTLTHELTHEQLARKQGRLRRELAATRVEPSWGRGRSGRLERLGRELAEIELALMTGLSIDAAAAESAARRRG